jgi:hypothetical protein
VTKDLLTDDDAGRVRGRGDVRGGTRADAAAGPGGRPRGGAPAGQPAAAGAQPLRQRPPRVRPLALPGLLYQILTEAAVLIQI